MNGYRSMTSVGFDICVTAAILGRLDGMTLPSIFAEYGVPDSQQWAAMAELASFDARLKWRRPQAVALAATAL